ncbi:MAG: cbb3-type cytochrome c oxidase subunit 3 [Gammaproteobacteria bacterium]|nr:MAG: cbb3-type cytochrome c oxidase subunit 3 [Gammaproteobacteria bacterium]RKZ39798.1 MAG: cbb3-type cytochrome c oxidase subunit 3 [Gammaproteobacteria bacterium]RKZ73242.1 MAG: cbb3-type cytochrome c oxidase subunit 3 [Gammaproteobacteria bacterium]
MAIFQSVWTIVVMVIFLTIVVWAYSRKRKPEFDEAARLPLDDDDSIETTVKEKHHV